MPAISKMGSKSRLYRGGKISDYRFLRVLDQFVVDATTTSAAETTRLSVNSVHAIYGKLRKFFFDVHLFRDFYQGQNPETYVSPDPSAELALLDFHLKRVGRKRGLRSPSDEPPYHFAESCWRFDFTVMMGERPSDAVHAMMRSHLLELIKLCGPVGAEPRNLEAGAIAVMGQIDQRIDWFRKNAPGFRSDDLRAELAQVRDIAS